MGSTFTFTQKTPPTVGASNFGGLVNDQNHNALTGVVGSGIQTSDATGTPITSPASVTTGTTLTVPLDATSLVLFSSAALRVSETSATSSYFVVPASVVFQVDVARMASIFLKQDSGACSVQFYFVVI